MTLFYSSNGQQTDLFSLEQHFPNFNKGKFIMKLNVDFDFLILTPAPNFCQFWLQLRLRPFANSGSRDALQKGRSKRHRLQSPAFFFLKMKGKKAPAIEGRLLIVLYYIALLYRVSQHFDEEHTSEKHESKTRNPADGYPQELFSGYPPSELHFFQPSVIASVAKLIVANRNLGCPVAYRDVLLQKIK